MPATYRADPEEPGAVPGQELAQVQHAHPVPVIATASAARASFICVHRLSIHNKARAL